MENKKNFYIDGKWVTAISKEEIKVINPATEEECAVISLFLFVVTEKVISTLRFDTTVSTL